jgi:hypothetical protein
MNHVVGCPKEADARNETCDCARLRGTSAPAAAQYAEVMERLGLLTEVCSYAVKHDAKFFSETERADFIKASCIIRAIAERHGYTPQIPLEDCDG